MARALSQIWRKWVLLFARRMPIESPGICMVLSLLALLTAIFLLPEGAAYAAACPGIAEALRGSKNGWRWLRGLETGLISGASGAAWLFQARCLQICYPEYYDPYAVD